MVKCSALALFCLITAFATAQELFPEKCIGRWSGKMLIYQHGQLRDSVQVRFTVAPLTPDS